MKALRTGIHRFEPVEIFRKDPDSDDYTGQYLRGMLSRDRGNSRKKVALKAG